MTDERPPIPAELRRRVLVEAGHRCAIPTCRHVDIDLHHIISWEQCHAHEYENLIALCPNCHRRANAGEIDRKSLRIYKANLHFAHDKFSQFEMDVLFALYKLPPGQAIPWPSFLNLLINRILDGDYVFLRPNPIGSVEVLGMSITPDHLYMTDKGKKFIESFGEETLDSESAV